MKRRRLVVEVEIETDSPVKELQGHWRWEPIAPGYYCKLLRIVVKPTKERKEKRCPR